jgi:hypothetical protein
MEVECYKLMKHYLIVVLFHQNCIYLVLNKQLFVVPRYYFLSVETAAGIAIPMSASAINSAPVASLRWFCQYSWTTPLGIVWSPHRNSFSGFATATVPAVHTCHCTVCTNILWFHRRAYFIALCNLSQHQATRPDVPYQTDSWDAGCSNGGHSLQIHHDWQPQITSYLILNVGPFQKIKHTLSLC